MSNLKLKKTLSTCVVIWIMPFQIILIIGRFHLGVCKVFTLHVYIDIKRRLYESNIGSLLDHGIIRIC